MRRRCTKAPQRCAPTKEHDEVVYTLASFFLVVRACVLMMELCVDHCEKFGGWGRGRGGA